jgi:hypothetical protein
MCWEAAMNKKYRGVSVMKKLSLFASFALLLSGCGLMDGRLPMDAEHLGDIAYDVAPRTGYTVYLQESGQEYAAVRKQPEGVYFPYLALTNDYDGSTLLLRQDIDEYHSYNDYRAYYEDSEVDVYLNTVVIERFPQALREAIVTSTITITEKYRTEVEPGLFWKVTCQIERKVFLLSGTETGFKYRESVLPIEGKKLTYFEEIESRIAYENGEAAPWLLRTPTVEYDSLASAVSPEGLIAPLNAFGVSGVRPAFCLPTTTPITTDSAIVPGETVYVIDYERLAAGDE